MPHLVLAGGFDAAQVAARVEPGVHRWGRAVLKIEECWVRRGGDALLVEGLAVEFSRPLHPVGLLEASGDDSILRLWRRAPVERTAAVQRWLAVLALELQRCGLGRIVTTNLGAEVLSDLGLKDS